jgi:hypothetical protein
MHALAITSIYIVPNCAHPRNKEFSEDHEGFMYSRVDVQDNTVEQAVKQNTRAMAPNQHYLPFLDHVFASTIITSVIAGLIFQFITCKYTFSNLMTNILVRHFMTDILCRQESIHLQVRKCRTLKTSLEQFFQ